ncbi:MAG: cobalamin biosynthesis protein CbiM, partial [Actinobacteria bacterium]|nr:cobalamin biosynthesis protein CbiM [Actinomycetota bacterium]
FVFAAQMLNFAIPGTGSSGHIGGALLLAVLLGPEAAFIVMASILAVQALFFADGGLLALGCNLFNLGFIPAFFAYPFVYRKIVRDGTSLTAGRVFAGSLLAAVVGLGLGAFAVVLETTASGVTELPFGTFVLLMQPIHLAIGVVEGLVTAAVLLFVYRAQPGLLARNAAGTSLRGVRLKPVLIGLGIAAVVAGAALSWFAATSADGLEWSVARTAGGADLSTTSSAHETAAEVQQGTTVLPDYAFGQGDEPVGEVDGEEGRAWPAVDPGTSMSGLVGGALVAGSVILLGVVLRRRSVRRRAGARP